MLKKCDGRTDERTGEQTYLCIELRYAQLINTLFCPVGTPATSRRRQQHRPVWNITREPAEKALHYPSWLTGRVPHTVSQDYSRQSPNEYLFTLLLQRNLKIFSAQDRRWLNIFAENEFFGILHVGFRQICTTSIFFSQRPCLCFQPGRAPTGHEATMNDLPSRAVKCRKSEPPSPQMFPATPYFSCPVHKTVAAAVRAGYRTHLSAMPRAGVAVIKGCFGVIFTS